VRERADWEKDSGKDTNSSNTNDGKRSAEFKRRRIGVDRPSLESCTRSLLVVDLRVTHTKDTAGLLGSHLLVFNSLSKLLLSSRKD